MKTQRPEQYAPILGGFVPIAALWESGPGAALFLSECSARWFLKTNRGALVEAEAIAMHAGRILVHLERLESVAQRIALETAKRRHGAH